MLKPSNGNKTHRVPYTDDDGHEVVICRVESGQRHTAVMFEYIDQEYCAEHPDEIKQLQTDFMDEADAFVTEQGLPGFKKKGK